MILYILIRLFYVNISCKISKKWDEYGSKNTCASQLMWDKYVSQLNSLPVYECPVMMYMGISLSWRITPWKFRKFRNFSMITMVSFVLNLAVNFLLPIWIDLLYWQIAVFLWYQVHLGFRKFSLVSGGDYRREMYYFYR